MLTFKRQLHYAHKCTASKSFGPKCIFYKSIRSKNVDAGCSKTKQSLKKMTTIFAIKHTIYQNGATILMLFETL